MILTNWYNNQLEILCFGAGAWLSWLERYLDTVEVGSSILLVPIFVGIFLFHLTYREAVYQVQNATRHKLTSKR